MRVANNLITYTLDEAEKEILRSDIKDRRLILTRDTALDKKKFDIR